MIARRHRALLANAAAAAIALCAAGLLTPRGAFFTRRPVDEYGEQADAYLSGQLHLKDEPAPAILALANPYAEGWRTGAARRDISLFHGHYYVYYGVAPIVTFIAPVRLLTGWWPTTALACAVFALLGAFIALWLLDDAVWRYAPGIPATARAAIWISVVLGNGVLCWMAEPGMYQLAQISGWCWLTVMLAALWSAHHSERPARGIAIASLAYGLAVASRPSLLFAAAALTASAWALRRKSVLLAAVLPAAAIGAGLAWLNAARFDSPLDFGMTYGINSLGDMRQLRFFSLDYLSSNLAVYLGGVPKVVARFPFLDVGWRGSVGLVVLPFCWFAAGAARATGELRRLALDSGLLALAVTLPLLLLLFHWSRYEMDFLSLWTLTGAVGVISLSRESRNPARIGRLALAAACVQTLMLAAVFAETIR